MDATGFLILRLVVGLYLFGHGTQKLCGWFGGHGLTGTTGFFETLGFRPARFWAVAGALAETMGGILFVLGLLNPLGALAIAAMMATAVVVPHWSKGIWNMNGGFELPLTNLAVAVAVALTGPGRYSLDTVFGIVLPEPITGIIATIVAVLAVAAALGSRMVWIHRQQHVAQAA